MKTILNLSNKKKKVILTKEGQFNADKFTFLTYSPLFHFVLR